MNVCNQVISNKICITASKTKYMNFMYNEKINLHLIKLGNHKFKKKNRQYKVFGVYFIKKSQI